MAKNKKHCRVPKSSAKKPNKNDNRRRKTKYVDPISGVSKDVRATVQAIVEEIERPEAETGDTAHHVQEAAKTRKHHALKVQEKTMVKNGMTKAQAHRIADRLRHAPLNNAPGANHKSHGTNASHGGAEHEEYTDEEDDNEQAEEEEEEEDRKTEEDFSDTANERAREYCKGGYHPVLIGEVYNNRYRVIHKLGWGYFSTVWLVWDYAETRYQAMKVQKSARSYTETAYDEIRLLSEIMHADPHKTRHCARLNDYFEHLGPNGTHVCMVFDVYGENLLTLIECYDNQGIPLPIVKSIARQVLIALDHLASIDIIHTDLKPENVLLATPKHAIISLMRRYHPPPQHQCPKLLERDPKTMTKSQRRRYYKRLAKEKEGRTTATRTETRTTLGSGGTRASSRSGSEGSKRPSEHPTNGAEAATKPTTQQDTEAVSAARECDTATRSSSARGKEGHHDSDSQSSKTDSEWEVNRYRHIVVADFGNSCWTYKHFTDEVQTRQYRSPEVILGEPYSTAIDVWSCACLIYELITGEFLFDPKKSADYSRDEDHLALISELLGDLPECMRLGNGKYRSYFYNSKGELRNIKKLNYWDLEDLLYRRHNFTHAKANEIAEFLLPMLEHAPEERATAAEMLRDFDSFFEVKDDDYNPRRTSERGSTAGRDSVGDVHTHSETGTDEEVLFEVHTSTRASHDTTSATTRTTTTRSDASSSGSVSPRVQHAFTRNSQPASAAAAPPPQTSQEGQGGKSGSRRDHDAAGEREAMRQYWDEHPILNRTALAARGLTILDIQAVLSGQTLATESAQAAANEVVRLLSEEEERPLSSSSQRSPACRDAVAVGSSQGNDDDDDDDDGRDADREDEGDSDAAEDYNASSASHKSPQRREETPRRTTTISRSRSNEAS